MALDQRLLDVLACPKDKGPLYYLVTQDIIYNPRLQLKYVVNNDIPVMLVDEAETADQAEHVRLMSIIESQGISPTFAA